MNLKEEIKERIKQKGLSLSEISKEIDISRQRLSKVLNSKSPLPLVKDNTSWVLKLEKILDYEGYELANLIQYDKSQPGHNCRQSKEYILSLINSKSPLRIYKNVPLVQAVAQIICDASWIEETSLDKKTLSLYMDIQDLFYTQSTSIIYPVHGIDMSTIDLHYWDYISSFESALSVMIKLIQTYLTEINIHKNTLQILYGGFEYNFTFNSLFHLTETEKLIISLYRSDKNMKSIIDNAKDMANK